MLTCWSVKPKSGIADDNAVGFEENHDKPPTSNPPEASKSRYPSGTFISNPLKASMDDIDDAKRFHEKIMPGVKVLDKKEASWMGGKTKVIKTIRALKWKWAGYLMRGNNKTWTRRVDDWIPRTSDRTKHRVAQHGMER